MRRWTLVSIWIGSYINITCSITKTPNISTINRISSIRIDRYLLSMSDRVQKTIFVFFIASFCFIPRCCSISSKCFTEFRYYYWNCWSFVITFSVKISNCPSVLASSVQLFKIYIFPKPIFKHLIIFRQKKYWIIIKKFLILSIFYCYVWIYYTRLKLF